jgi:hypothetical protein
MGSLPASLQGSSPWENGYRESFKGKLRDECLNGEISYSLKEAQIMIEKWRVEHNTPGLLVRMISESVTQPRFQTQSLIPLAISPRGRNSGEGQSAAT